MRRGESIYKRKDGRFEGRYVKKYKEKRAIYGYVYARSYSDCKVKRNIVMNKKITSGKIKMDKELNYIVYKWLYSKTNLKESSFTRYYNLISTHIKTDIGVIKIYKLNKQILDEYINNKLLNGKLNKKGGLSKNTVYDICTILRQVFKEYNIEIDITKINKEVGRGKRIYENEILRLEKTLLKLDNTISVGILLSLYLGLRESEVCGLSFCDIDIDNKIIHINKIVSRVKSFNTINKTKLILSTPKTQKSKRELPIPDKLIKILKEIKNKSKEDNFLLTNTDRFMDPRKYYYYYKNVLNSLNIKNTYHDLRHTFATNCIEKGIDYKSLMELLGHANVTTTMNIYVHPSMENKRTYINKL